MNYPNDEKPSQFARVPDKVGSKPYHRYVAMIEEGPIYYALGLDEDADEFEIGFDDGCATLLTHNRNYIVLSDSNLSDIQTLNAWAEEEYERWAQTELGRALEAKVLGELSKEDKLTFRADYDRLIGTRREVLVR